MISLRTWTHQGPAPWAIGDRGLNVSTEVSTRTPRFHQPHLLWEPSSSPKPLSQVVQVDYFFFSSRRRHTSWTGDWSSRRVLFRSRHDFQAKLVTEDGGEPLLTAADGQGVARSEERRVGKECSSRWSPYHSKKKDKDWIQYENLTFISHVGIRVVCFTALR